ncbi:MAG: hypothetical protein H0W63_09945 [Gemmatimonadaceae bacterium]|nr:hypothetical protein [Gemmatimonadaceae bacterium]
MTAFVSDLRARKEPLVVGEKTDSMFRIRAQVLEAWDAIRIDANPSQPVSAVKLRALEELYPEAPSADEFVVKLHGFEVLDENVSLADAGVKNGSILLIADRRRRPVS